MKGTVSNTATPTNSSVGPVTYVQKLTRTDYMAGGFQYKDEVIEFIPHAEGFIKNDKDGYVYYFNYTDHLGNVRVTYTDDGSGTPYVVEESNYYPFGLKHKGYNEPDQNMKDWGNILTMESSLNHKYKYQGQELEDELGKNTYAYQWRDYDPTIGRFNKIDRFSEKYLNHSLYAFTKNNPIKYREMAGDSIWVTTRTIKGRSEFTIHFRGKVYNASDSNINMKEYTKALTKNLSSSLRGNSGNISVKTDVSITTANSMKDIKKSDHLLVIVDNVEGNADSDKGGNAAGLGKKFGQIAYTEAGSFDWMVASGIHEYGHNLGLEHSWKDDYDDNDSGTNYMDYADNRNGPFSFQQMMGIIGNANSGQLNQGNPTQKAPYTTNNWFWNTATNTQPWDFNVKKGDIIPTILKNN